MLILGIIRVNLSIEWQHINIEIVLYKNSIQFFCLGNSKSAQATAEKNYTEHLKFRLCHHFVHTYTLVHNCTKADFWRLKRPYLTNQQDTMYLLSCNRMIMQRKLEDKANFCSKLFCASYFKNLVMISIIANVRTVVQGSRAQCCSIDIKTYADSTDFQRL